MTAPDIAGADSRLWGSDSVAIKSFHDKITAALYDGQYVRSVSRALAIKAQRKLSELDAAHSLSDLSRPGNHLEALRGDREGQWSIRVNDQWRLCFVWQDGHAHHVELTDYH